MKIELLLKMQKKLELMSCFLSELENAASEIDNDYHFARIDKNDTTFQNIVTEFFHIKDKICEKKIHYIKEKITSELSKCCNHQFVEDDIEYNIDREMHITYCIICGVDKSQT